MKEDTIQHLASEMDELQEQHRDVLAKVRFSMDLRVFSFVFLLFCENVLSKAQSKTNLISSIQIIHTYLHTYLSVLLNMGTEKLSEILRLSVE